MKKCFFSVLGFIFILTLKAQDCTFYFPSKSGTSFEMKTYDGKNKLTGNTKSKVLESTGSKVKFTSEAFDSKGNVLAKGDYEVKCENGEFVVDMKSYLKDMDMSKFKDMQLNFETKDMSYPAKMEPGQKLNDGEITLTISTQQGMKFMTMTTKILNRTVQSIEDITTPAGTFKCVKITSDVESKTMFTVKTKMTEWISSKVGIVRYESNDQKGKLLSYSLLSAFSE